MPEFPLAISSMVVSEYIPTGQLYFGVVTYGREKAVRIQNKCKHTFIFPITVKKSLVSLDKPGFFVATS